MFHLISCVSVMLPRLTRTPDGNAVCYELEGEATPPEAGNVSPVAR